jgi:hypothetical protein
MPKYKNGKVVKVAKVILVFKKKSLHEVTLRSLLFHRIFLEFEGNKIFFK